METIWIPIDIKKFLFDYSHSKFIECNSTMANYNLQKYPDKSQQNKDLNNKINPGLIYIKKILESSYKKYWIASGSLLGQLITVFVYDLFF